MNFKSLNWYRHKVTSHTHWKFRALRTFYGGGDKGWAMEGRFWALNNILASSESSTLMLDHDLKFNQTAAEIDLTPNDFQQFIDYLIQCHLINYDQENRLITTKMTQEDLEKLEETRERKRKWAEENKDRRQNNNLRQPIDDYKNKLDVENSKNDSLKHTHNTTQHYTTLQDNTTKVGVTAPVNNSNSAFGIIQESGASDLAQKTHPSKKKFAPKKKVSNPDAEPFWQVFIGIFIERWKQKRKTKYTFEAKDAGNLKKVIQKIRGQTSEQWTEQVARREWEKFLSNAEHDTLISKNNFENFTPSFFNNRFNSIFSQNGKHVNTRGTTKVGNNTTNQSGDFGQL